VRYGNRDAMDTLAERVVTTYGGEAPVVLDMFSGRAIIPLEAARAGARAIGIDLSPVATLAGRLLADYPARDWSTEPALPYESHSEKGILAFDFTKRERLARDVEVVFAEVGRRVAERMEPYYPRNEQGECG
jgi:adenine-specific DNA methylase